MEQIEESDRHGRTSEEPCSSLEQQWIAVQDSLKKRLITEDEFAWKLTLEGSGDEKSEELKYVGGVDISFSKDDPSIACATVVVLNLRTLDVVYEDFSLTALDIPYIPGANIVEPFEQNEGERASVLSSGFGLGCHLGVLADLPTIGIGKNLHHVDGLSLSRVKQVLEDDQQEFSDLIGISGCTLGTAMRSATGASKPIFVSVGHRISLTTAIKIVKMTCKYRVPEPIRQIKLV
ncbi:hypothetical protein V2J09_017460 [Rumex salicifolius]